MGAPVLDSAVSGVGETENVKKVGWRKNNQTLLQVKKLLGHFGLFLALIFYTAAGALIFQKLEYEEEIIRKLALKGRLDLEKENFLKEANNIISTSRRTPASVNESLHGLLLKFVDNLEDIRSQDQGLPLNVADSRSLNDSATWKDFSKSVFFASTVITTIGYGDMAPYTRSGRLFCILFALFGIPFTLTVIADVGKLMASAVSGVSKRLKKSFPRKNVIRTQQSRWKKFGKSATVVAAVIFLLLYITFGGWLFTLWEYWDFFDSFYFCFISMTTIGLGDLVPNQTNYLILCVYIIIGLALTSTSIELVRSQYADSWRKMRELSTRLGPLAESLKRHGANINLDVNVLQDLKDLKKVLAMSGGKMKREGSIWKKFWENEDGYEDDNPDSNEPRLIQIIIYESSV